MRGLSAILAMIMIVIIVISIVGLFYTFSASIARTAMSSTQSSVNATTTNMLTQMNILSMSMNDVIIKNTGLNDISASSIDVYINNEPADFSLTPPLLRPNEIGIVKIYDFIKENDDISIGTGNVFTGEKATDPCEEAVLCFKFEETGISIIDSSPYKNNGISYSGSTPTDFHTPNGRYGNALSFNDVDNYVRVSDDTDFDFGNFGAFTIEAWIKSTSSNWETIIARGAADTSMWDIALAIDGEIIPYFADRDGENRDYITPDTDGLVYNDNNWHHIAIVVNSSNVSIYVDGKKVQSGPRIDNDPPFDYLENFDCIPGFDCDIYIGAESPTAAIFPGLMDEVRIYNKAIY